MNRRELLKFLTALGVVGTPGISKSVFAQGLGIGVIATRF